VSLSVSGTRCGRSLALLSSTLAALPPRARRAAPGPLVLLVDDVALFRHLGLGLLDGGDLLLLLREAQIELSLLRVEAVEEVGLLDVVRLHRGESGQERVGVSELISWLVGPGRSRLDLRGDDVADLVAELVDDLLLGVHVGLERRQLLTGDRSRCARC
jgi:hypothetical protein